MKTYRGKEDQHQVMANIFLYAVDKKNLRYKGDSYIALPDPKIAATRILKVARIQYPGNWDPEPGGWRQLAAVMHNTHSVDLTVEPVKLGGAPLAGFQLAHLTGTFRFHFSEAQRNAIKDYVESGGTLVVDAAGGSAEFGRSAEDELTAIFGDAAKPLYQPLPVEHPLYAAGGQKLGSISYRTFCRKLFVGALNVPRLRGIEINKRLSVIYSPDDLSVGIVGQPVDGIIGYDPESATRLMAKVLEFVAPK
jgi:hypothetical protein